jgi:hypothetical protein
MDSEQRDATDAKAEADILAAMEAKMMQQEEEMKSLKARIRDLEFDEDAHYPQDCYSFIAVHGPGSAEWRPGIFAFGFLAFLFQMMFLVMFFLYIFRRQDLSKLSEKDIDPIVVTAQFTAVLFFSLMPDASLQDIITAHQIWPRTKTEDKTGRMLSCIARFTQGFTATLVALLLIVSSDTSKDIILNFTAVNFISEIDATLFALAKNNVFGGRLAICAENISTKNLPEKATTKKDNRYQVIMVLIFAVMFTATVIFTARMDWREDAYRFFGGEAY